MGVPGADDIMLGYQSTSFHDALYVRSVLGLKPAPEFELAESLGIMDYAARVRPNSKAMRRNYWRIVARDASPMGEGGPLCGLSVAVRFLIERDRVHLRKIDGHGLIGFPRRRLQCLDHMFEPAIGLLIFVRAGAHFERLKANSMISRGRSNVLIWRSLPLLPAI